MKVGSDIEMIAVDGNNIPRSVIGLLGGTKENPRKTKHGWIQEDNVLPEFNIPPCTTAQEFSEAIRLVIEDVDLELMKHGLTSRCISSCDYPKEELQHELALLAGCDPDVNIYILDYNSKPCLEDTLLRTAGAHVHVSWEEGHDLDKIINFVRAMDVHLGLPSVLLDEDKRRRTLYGKAGACRVKKYGDESGVEYRTLSNFWVKNDTLRQWVFSNTVAALASIDHIDYTTIEGVEHIINNGDRAGAMNLIHQYNVVMP